MTIVAQESVLQDFLTQNQIPYIQVDHPPVFTCEEAALLMPPIEGAETKNLFLRDDRRARYFLVSVPAAKRADLKALAVLLGVKRLTMGSSDDLASLLGVSPGSVTLLAAINDREQRVEIMIDAGLWRSERLCCHPLVNTSTLSIAREDMARFLALTGHDFKVADIPARD